MSKLQPTTPPKGVFVGINIMTPDVLGYYKLRSGYVELSEGTGFQNGPIFGVTVGEEDEKGPDERSELFFSKQEALSYIESLS